VLIAISHHLFAILQCGHTAWACAVPSVRARERSTRRTHSCKINNTLACMVVGAQHSLCPLFHRWPTLHVILVLEDAPSTLGGLVSEAGYRQAMLLVL
jgi:hypothetical protein